MPPVVKHPSYQPEILTLTASSCSRSEHSAADGGRLMDPHIRLLLLSYQILISACQHIQCEIGFGP